MHCEFCLSDSHAPLRTVFQAHKRRGCIRTHTILGATVVPEADAVKYIKHNEALRFVTCTFTCTVCCARRLWGSLRAKPRLTLTISQSVSSCSQLHFFRILTPSRIYICASRTPEERSAWLAALAPQPAAGKGAAFFPSLCSLFRSICSN